MRVFVAIACTIAVASSASVSAQGKGAGPKVKTSSVPVTHASGSTHGKGATYKPTSAGRPTTTTTKTTAAHGGGTKPASTTVAKGGGHARTTELKTAHGKAARSAPTSTTTSSPTTSTTSTASTTGTTTDATGTTAATQTPLTPVQQKLQKNTNLASKLQSRLPAGTDVTKAAAGFKNLGQFVAAVNVSNNLGLNFTTLKTAMVTDGKSLGQAIQAQKGTTVDASTEASRAQTDADTLIRSTETSQTKQKPARSGRS